MKEKSEVRKKILKSLTRHSYEDPLSYFGTRFIRLDTARRIIKYHLKDK